MGGATDFLGYVSGLQLNVRSKSRALSTRNLVPSIRMLYVPLNVTLMAA